MKRLLHIIDNFSEGAGAEQVLLGTINNLPGYKNYLLYFNKPDGLLQKLDKDVEVVYFQINNKFDIIKAVRFLQKFILDNKIDAIHAHLTQSIIVTKLARIKSIPVFITYHSIFLTKYKIGPIPTLSYLAHLVSYKKNQVSIGVSNAVLQTLQKQYRMTHNLHCVYNFIDDKFLNATNIAQPSRANTSKFKIICIGNIRPEKNFGLIFDAFDQRFKNDNNIELDVWGANRMPVDYAGFLASKGIHNLHIKGPDLSLQKKIPLYDLFISSSEYESFGISVLEAMALNVPVLLSDIPAFKELYSGCAVFFKSGSVADFTDKLHSIITDPGSTDKNRTAAFQFAQKFSVKTTVNNLSILYEKYIA